MLTKLNGFIIDISASWWKFLLVLATQVATMRVMMGWINPQFPDVSGGHPPFDMQNDLTVEQVFSQLETYTERAFELYAIFQAVDYIFPLAAGLVLATICAFGLRNTSAKYYEIAKQKNLFLLILVATVFDWLENLNLLWVVIGWPEQINSAAQLAVIAKQGKLAFMNISFGITGILLLTGTFGWARKRLRGASKPD